PLRSKHWIINKLYLLVFKFLISKIFKNLVITSNGFLSCLPKNKNYLLCENLPPESLIPSTNFNKKRTMRIGFVGALRYPKQMLMLIRFCLENGKSASFYGGPKENQKYLEKLCEENGLDIKENIKFFGDYNQSDLQEIYNEIDFVYSVYDASQPNVRLALPNKLYESQLFRTPIIVASETYLSHCVSELNIGFSVDSINYEQFSYDMKNGLNKYFEIDSSNVIKNIKESQAIFDNWIGHL
ncbi:hypothetical protein ACPF41_003627, partial [Vibrio cholerae]